MNRQNLKILIKDLKFILSELQAEVYGDPESYIDKGDTRKIAVEDDDGTTD